MIQEFKLALPSGITLACRGAGQGRARAMMLHGFPEAAFVWDAVMQSLAPRFACVAPNLRGFIGSSAPTEVSAYRAKALVGDIAAAIEALGAPLDLLVAHDWGGALAWNLAAQRPHLMRRLLIINSPHPAAFLRELRHNALQQEASAYMSFLCRADAEALLTEHDYRRLWPFLGEPAWLKAEVREQYRQAWMNEGRGLAGALNYYRASPLRPPKGPDDDLHRISLADADVTSRVPTTVLWGERDHALLPALLDGLGQWVPQLKIRRVPEASHWIVHEQPDLVAQTVADLLN